MSQAPQKGQRQRGEGWLFTEAVRWQAAPEGDARRVCEDCASPEHA